MMLEALRAAVDRLREVDTGALHDDELGALHVELREIENQLDAQATRLVAEWDSRKAWTAGGARSASSWLAHRCRMPHPTARRRVRLARARRSMPHVSAAWDQGRIESAHVAVLDRVRTDATTTAYERDESMLVEQATSLRFDDFCRVTAYWHQHADPDGSEDQAQRRFGERRAHLSQTFGGMWVGDLLFDAVGGAIVDGTLRQLEHELFETDWAEARARLGRGDPTVLDLARTSAQRRADAWVEMAVRARMAPTGGRRPAPLFTVLVGYETLAGPVCELANRTALTPGGLVPWLTQADVERVVFDGPSRVIDVGVYRRLFDGATRRAVEVRDRNRCYVPDCDAVDELQIDHVEPFAAGGRTVRANGRVACDVHNRGRHRRQARTGATTLTEGAAPGPSAARGPAHGAHLACPTDRPGARLVARVRRQRPHR